jgi:hypothetical protein
MEYGFQFIQRNPGTLLIQSFAHDCRRTLVCAEYGYPNRFPNTRSSRRNPSLQLSVQRSPQRAPRRTTSEHHGATRQQAIVKTPAKRSAYQIHSLIAFFVVIVFKVSFVSLILTSYNRPTTYQLQKNTTEHSSTCKSHSHKLQQAQNPSVTEERY